VSSLPEMPCRELVEVITDYLEDALPADDRARFEAHLHECGPCRDYVEQFREVIAASGRLAPEDVPPETRDELARAFRAWSQGP